MSQVNQSGDKFLKDISPSTKWWLIYIFLRAPFQPSVRPCWWQNTIQVNALGSWVREAYRHTWEARAAAEKMSNSKSVPALNGG